MSTITCFGEVLWDVFPDHKKIGGAPLNVAIRLASFGNDVNMISSIGQDTDGEVLLNYIKTNDINTDSIQTSSNFSTSKVLVSLDESGSASYIIEKPCSWDDIHISETMQSLVNKSDAFVFGSLCARSDTSKSTLIKLLDIAKYKIFDINLRKPHYDKSDLLELMNHADLIKFNDDEITEICSYLNFDSESIEEMVVFISSLTKTNEICVTKGSKGALFYKDGNFYNNTGYNIKIKDTVGAGDSFLASLINSLLIDTDIQTALDKACAIGAIVASKEGATPDISSEEIKEFFNSQKS